MLPLLNNFTKYFELLFLCYQSKDINKKHQKSSSILVEITIVLLRKTNIKFPRYYLTKPSNNFMILIFIITSHSQFHNANNYIRICYIFLSGNLLIMLTPYFSQTINLIYTWNYLLFWGCTRNSNHYYFF